MTRWARGLWMVAVLAVQPAAAQTSVNPLFAEDRPLHLIIKGPIDKLASERGKGAASAATIAVAGAAEEPLAITLSPRGITRRTKDICRFPPLRVQFDKPPPAGSLFAAQRRLKLVTHCRPDADFQQYVLLEYAAYRLYGLMTPLSFGVRLATIDYVDTKGRPTTTRVGFFIEDVRDVAHRNGAGQAKTAARIPVATLDATATARAAMFNYMIGNLDFAFNAGPAGSPCCHNGRLLKGAGQGLTPVPYDFDFSGLVDAPYATPPETIPLPNVRVRVYRGFCQFNAANRAAAAEFADRRAALLAVLDTIPDLNARIRAKAAAYLDGFFRVAASPEAVEKTLLAKCI